MKRSDYIRLAAALLLPHCRPEGEPSRLDLDKAITWAEALDARLAARGYAAGDGGAPDRCAPGGGPAEAGAPRGAPGGGGEPRKRGRSAAPTGLSAEQEALFRRFWSAYGYHKDRGRCAVAWGRLAPDAATAEAIIAAASADARQAQPGGALYLSGIGRKYPERWLRERCWEDAATTADGRPRLDPAEAARRHRLLGLQSEIAGLSRQIEVLERSGAPVPDAIRRGLSTAQAQLAEVQGR